MKRLITVGLLLAVLAVPSRADAGVKSALKKVGHVAKVSVLYVAVAVAAIEFCAHGGCR